VTLNVSSVASLCAACIGLAGCGAFGRVNQGQVVRYQKDQGLVTVVGDSNFKEPGKPRFDVLPAVIVRTPEDPREMGPEPEPGRLLRLDWQTRMAVIFDTATQSFGGIPFTVVEQHENVRRSDPLVDGKRFPVIDAERRTITVYSARDRMVAVLSVGDEHLRLPEDTWKFGDEIRYYYKDPARALRIMNVTKTDLNSAEK
jgi:hypothetical protein